MSKYGFFTYCDTNQNIEATLKIIIRKIALNRIELKAYLNCMRAIDRMDCVEIVVYNKKVTYPVEFVHCILQVYRQPSYANF